MTSTHKTANMEKKKVFLKPFKSNSYKYSFIYECLKLSSSRELGTLSPFNTGLSEEFVIIPQISCCISAPAILVFLADEPGLKLGGVAGDLGLGAVDRRPLEAETVPCQQAWRATSWVQRVGG